MYPSISDWDTGHQDSQLKCPRDLKIRWTNETCSMQALGYPERWILGWHGLARYFKYVLYFFCLAC